MKLRSEFLRLPFRFDVDRLVKEASSIPDSEWMPHPTGFKGNTAVPLISVDGGMNDDFAGPMQQTAALKDCEYIQQALASFDSVLGRSRLMRLEGRCQVPEHADINYHWYNRVRIHIPIITDPAVRFICNGREINMKPGEAWLFDTWKRHSVHNDNDITRIHLVIDTSGSAKFWDTVSRAEDPFDTSPEPFDTELIPYQAGRKVTIRTERYNTPEVMSPGEMDALTKDLMSDLLAADLPDQLAVASFCRAVDTFRQDWRQTWQEYAYDVQGVVHYKRLISNLNTSLSAIGKPLLLASNQIDASQIMQARILIAALSPARSGNHVSYGEYGSADQRNPQQSSVGQINAAAKKKKVGRNEPCPCGSGKKYKQCHG